MVANYPAPKLDSEERAEVKKVARELLPRLKQLLVPDWRQRSAARSQLKLTIEDVLDTGTPRLLFEHFYEPYPERNKNIYATVG